MIVTVLQVVALLLLIITGVMVCRSIEFSNKSRLILALTLGIGFVALFQINKIITANHTQPHQYTILIEAAILLGTLLVLLGVLRLNQRYKTGRPQSTGELLQHFGRFLDHSFNEIYIFDAQTLQFTHANQGALRNSGYTLVELQHLQPFALTRDCSEESFRQLIAPMVQGEQDQITIETTHIRKDGSQYTAEVNLQYLGDERPPVFIAIINDISERRETEYKLRQHETELAHATRLAAMGEITSGIAHEMNQPLSAIINYARGGMRRYEVGELTAEQSFRVLRRIDEQAERAVHIIQRLRSFVRKKQPHYSTIDINELVSKVIDFVESVHPERHIIINTELDVSLPAILADPIHVEQVITNLVLNAIEAMQQIITAQPTIILETGKLNDTELYVQIADTGPGVSPECADEIFKPFYTTKPGGLGLGLSLSQSIIQSHGGRMWQENRPDRRGAVFYITLPINPYE